MNPAWMSVLFFLVLAQPSVAAKVYKWVDEDGNVSYRDKPPPKGSKGRIEEKHIDPDINITKPTPVKKDKKKETDGTVSDAGQGRGGGGLPVPAQGVLENDTSKPPVRGPEKKVPDEFKSGPEKRDPEKLKPGLPIQPVQPPRPVPGPALRTPPPASGPGI